MTSFRQTPLLADATQAMSGGYDLHIHTAPDAHHADRWYDDLGYSREALAAGMGGAVLKNHYTYTGDRAALVREAVPDFDVYGGLCLDAAVGGINPWAVEAALRSSEHLCRIVWFPTISAATYPNRNPAFAGPGVPVLDESGRLLPEVYDVFEALKGATCAIATGHLSYPEQLVLLKEATAFGLERMIVTHVDAPYLKLGIPEQLELSKYAYLEHAAMHFLSKSVDRTAGEVLESIRVVGPSRCILSTDLGQDYNPDPVRGLLTFCSGLLRGGLDVADVQMMLRTNPLALLL